MIDTGFRRNSRGAVKNIIESEIDNELKSFILDTRVSVIEAKGLTSHKLVTRVFAKAMETTLDNITKRSRTIDLILERQIMCWAIRCFTPLSFAQAGLVLERDHATILYSMNKVFDMLTDKVYGSPTVKALIEKCIVELRSEIKITDYATVTNEEYLSALDIVRRYQSQKNIES